MANGRDPGDDPLFRTFAPDAEREDRPGGDDPLFRTFAPEGVARGTDPDAGELEEVRARPPAGRTRPTAPEELREPSTLDRAAREEERAPTPPAGPAGGRDALVLPQIGGPAREAFEELAEPELPERRPRRSPLEEFSRGSAGIAPGPRAPDQRTELEKGVITGLTSNLVGAGEVAENFTGLTGRFGRLDMHESDVAAQNFSNRARRLQQENMGRVPEFTSIRSLRDLADWSAFAFGQGAASTLSPIVGSLIGGGIGAAAGGPAAPGTAPAGAIAGAAAGAFLPSYSLLMGEIRGELESEDIPDEVIDTLAPRLAVPAAALEGLLPMSLGAGIRKRVTSEVARGLARRVARGTVKGLLTEAGTEATQQAISTGAAAALSPDKEFFTPDTFLDLFNSAMAGALPGGAFGATGALTEGAAAPGPLEEFLEESGMTRQELENALETYRRSLQGEAVAPEEAPPAPAAAQEAEEGVAPTEGPAQAPEPSEPVFEPPASEEDAVPETGRAPVRERGQESQVELADGRTLPVEYAIVDVGQTAISHDPVTFQPRADFPEGIQDRRYESDAGAQDLVASRSADLRPSLLLDQTTLATNGPPIMRPDGLTLSGNERTMLILRAREQHPALYQQYLTELTDRAESFGLNRESAQRTIEGMLERGQVPALGRVLTGQQPSSRSALASIMSAANEVGMKARDPLAEAAVQATRLREDGATLEFFAETIQPDETIRSYLDRSDGRQFLQGLIQNGVIPRTQTSRYRDRDGAPTPEGKQLIERMMLGAAIQDANVVDQAPPGWLRKVEKAIPAIVETQGDDGWNISPVLQEALELGTAVATNPEVRNVETLTTQTELDGPRFSPAAEALAGFIEQHSPNEVADALRQYARASQAARDRLESHDLFGEDPSTPAEAFSNIFGGELEAGTLDEVALDPAEAQELEEARAWLESIEDDPRVVEVRELPQPGDPDDTENLHPYGEAPERDGLRQTWFDTVWNNMGFASQERWFAETGISEPYEVAHERQLFIITGPPAAGKSSLANPLLPQARARLADGDEFKALTPEFRDSEGGRAGEVHRESAWLTDQLVTAAMEAGENIVMPAVGKTMRNEEGDGLAQVIEAAEQMGYDVHLIYNDLPPLKAAKRALARFFSTGRWVPPEYVINKVWRKPERNYETLKDSPLLTSAQRYSNDVARGELPILVESRGTPPIEIPTQGRGDETGRVGGESPGARPVDAAAAQQTPRARAPTGLPGDDPRGVEPAETPDTEQAHVDMVAQELYGLEWIEFADEARPRSLVELLSQAIDNAQDEEMLENILEIMDSEAERIGAADVAMLRERAREHAQESDLEVGLEVQEGLFGAQDRTLTGEEQRDMFPDEGPEGLEDSEARARNTAERLRPIIAAGHGTNAELEAYAEALKLLHRNELLDNEEVTARARRLEREIESVATTDQAELFELRVFDRRAPQQTEPAPLWRQPRNEWAGEPPVQPASPEYREWQRKDRLWAQAMREAISEGRITVEDAQELGYRPSGREAPLPDAPLYHVTTSRSSVLEVGVRSPAQSSLEERQVLGGTDGTNIPLTTELEQARAFRDAIFFARRFLRGDMTVQELLEAAHEHADSSRAFAGQIGRMYERGWTYGEELPEALQGELEIAELMKLLNHYFMFREASGGPQDPGFEVTDADRLRDVRPGEVSVVEVRPANPRAMGERTTSGSWRVQSSRAVEVREVDGRSPATWKSPSESGPTERGYAESVIAEELELRAEEVLRDTPERAAAGPEEEVTPLSKVREDIEEVLGRPIRQGRLRKLARAFGIYQVTPEAMRTRAKNDIHTIAHELGHHMHKLLFVRAVPSFNPRRPGRGLPLAPLRPWASELRPLAEGISSENIAEGWAEYWRLWITNRPVAEEKAPKLTAYLEDRLAKEHANIYDGVRRWQRWLEGYHKAAPWVRVRSRTAYSEDHMGWARNWRRGMMRLYQEVMDRFIPLSAAQRDLVGMSWQDRIQHLNENPEHIPKMMADLTDGAAGMADHWVNFGPVDHDSGRPIEGEKSLVGILEPVSDTLEEFEDYIIARRVLHLQKERGLDQGYDNADLEATIEHHLEEWPHFEQVADELHDFQQLLLEYTVDAGVITEETAEAFREGNPFYVPLYKVQDPMGQHGFKDGQAHLFSPFKRIGDSDRDVVPPLESIVKNVYFYTKLVQRQRVQTALASMAELQGAGRWIRPVDPPNVPTGIGQDEVIDWMRKALADELGFRGLDDSMLKDISNILPELMTVFRPGDFYGAENVISHVVNEEDPETGEVRQVRKWFEVEPEIFEALEHNAPVVNSKLTSLFAFPAKLLRVGATALSPGFVARNPFRDQLSAGVQSEFGYTPFVDLAPALFHILGRSDRYAAFLRSGGSFSALVDMDRDGVAQSLARLREGPIKHVVKNPLSALQALSAALENTTRMGEYLNTLRAGGETTGVIGRWRRDLNPEARAEAEARVEGATREEAALAGWMAREISTQFSTHGSSTTVQVIHRLSAFLNARWQSYARLARAAKNDPAGFSLRAFSMLTLPTIMLYMMNRDDEEYWELPQWMRDLHWMIKLPNVTKDMVPSGLLELASSDEQAGFLEQVFSPFVAQGDTVWVRLPIPWELGLVFKTMPERLLEWWDADDPEGLEQAVKQNFWQTFSGSVMPIPTFAVPLIENWANYSFFRQAPIDPSWENAPPKYIRRPGTSEVAIGMVEAMDRMGVYNIPGTEKLIGSPQKVDNLLYGYGGGFARLATDLASAGLRVTGTLENVQRVQTVADVPVVGGFVGRQSGFGSDSEERFRRRWERVRGTRAAMQLLEREGRTEQLARERRDPEVREDLALHARYSNVANTLSGLYASANQIERNPRLSNDEKAERIRELGARATELTRETIGRELPADRNFPLSPPFLRPED